MARVLNSWGPGAGEDGEYVATEAWLRAHTYEVVVSGRFLPANLQGLLGVDPEDLSLEDLPQYMS